MDSKKQLKIKTGVCKRNHKEYLSYFKEAEKQQTRIDKLKAENADAADIRQQEQVLAESLGLIPDCKKRLQAAVEALKKLMAEVDSNEEIKTSEEFKQAEVVLAEAEPALSSS